MVSEGGVVMSVSRTARDGWRPGPGGSAGLLPVLRGAAHAGQLRRPEEGVTRARRSQT